MNTVAKFAVHQGLAALGRQTWRWPLGVYVYLTFRCNLGCAYCDGGSGRPFPQMTSSELTPSDWSRLFPRLREHSDVLLLSGGEPTVYPGLLEVIRHARAAGFRFISLNTNGILLDDPIIDAVDAIIISLDSLDRGKSDRLWNRVGATDEVVRRLEQLAQRFRTSGQPSVMINSVILPDNLDDVAEVLAFCARHDITFSAGPALDKTRPVEGLRGNPRYHALVDRLITAKRSGQRIAATLDYLNAVKRFRSFTCHPQLVWRVYPDGSLVFPCSRHHRTIGNLLTNPDPTTLFRAEVGGELFDPQCDESCPLSCYMDTSAMIHRPLGLLREGLYRWRTFGRGHRLVY